MVMQVKLIVVVGKANKGTVALKLPTIIGRSREAQLTVAHPMISRQHCEVYEEAGLLMIRDLGSLNGTLVEGRRIREAPLRPDAEFTVGPLTFRAEYKYAGDLDSLPAVKLADEAAQPHEAESDEQIPDFESLGETPNFSPADIQTDQPPTGDQEPDFAAWEPMAAKDEEGEEEEDEPEPTPPPPMPPKEESTIEVNPDSRQSQSIETDDDDLDDFLKGLP